MNYKNTLALLPAAILAACGGGGSQEVAEPRTPGSVVYSYPSDGQSGVSPKADLVLRFSHALSDDDAADKIRISDGDSDVSFTVEGVDGNHSLKLMPEGELAPGTEYTVEFTEGLFGESNRIIETPNAVGAEGIQFTTRGAYTGIAGLDNLSDNFGVEEMIPSPNSVFKPMNFSTFRLRLTQPVHPEWEARGGVVEITDRNGDRVPANILVKGRLVTIDPCVPDDPDLCGREDDVLTPGETYTVSLRNMTALNGDVLDSFSQDITPGDTSPTVVLFQEVIDSGLNSGRSASEARRSKLNGEIINGVTLNSVLQGTAGPSQQTGGLFAELAFAPSFEADEPLPLRVPKGSLLNSSSLDVRINGLVPILDPETGDIQQTGNIKVTLLSDATGYLLPNPYTDDQNAPRHVKLFMDVSMNTEEAQPNASLSQDLLSVELSGISLVEDGILTIDAIGIVEPNLLGQEFTDATIAFRIEAATDADSQLDAADQRDDVLQDNTAPQLVSWMPGPENAVPETRQDMQRPGDPVVLNFDEPLDADSVAGGVTLDADGTPLTVTDGTLNAKVDGTVLVLNPEGGLQHGVDYAVTVNGVTDIAGNAASVGPLTFRLPEIGEQGTVPQRSPIALTTYPGYPCYVDQSDTPVNLQAGTHGQCADAASGGPLGEMLPVTTLPKDRPIVVVFSQSMDLDSIRLNDTFTVRKVNANGTDAGPVPGRLEKNKQRIRFYPDEPWDVDGFYRYTMHSAANGDCTQTICGDNGRALKTDLLVNPESVGGPDMEIYFRGTESTNTVFTPLRNLPIRDTNSNYVIDCDTLGGTDCLEPFEHESDGNGGFLPSANAAKLEVSGSASLANLDLIDARVGCAPSGSDCPENKFIYQTYGLNTELIGRGVDEEGNEGVRVLLYPTMLATTSASVFLTGLGEQETGPQILRMTYGDPDPEGGNPLGLVEGIIIEGEDGRPTFKTTADLTLDAPNLGLPDGGALLEHNLYSYEIELQLEGPIVFFDDGRMQVEQRNINAPAIDVIVSGNNALIDGGINLINCLTGIISLNPAACGALVGGDDVETGAVAIPLQIPANGVYLNFLSNPIKEIPEDY